MVIPMIDQGRSEFILLIHIVLLFSYLVTRIVTVLLVWSSSLTGDNIHVCLYPSAIQAIQALIRLYEQWRRFSSSYKLIGKAEFQNFCEIIYDSLDAVSSRLAG